MWLVLVVVKEIGGLLVMQGHINLGQFVAAELIIFGVLSSFSTFIGKLEYLYDMREAWISLVSFRIYLLSV